MGNKSLGDFFGIGPASREEQDIVRVLYSDAPGPYEASQEEQDEADRLEATIERDLAEMDLCKRLGTFELYCKDTGDGMFQWTYPELASSNEDQ